MSTEKIRLGQPSTPATFAAAADTATITGRLFRKTDWLTFLLTFAVVGLGYYLTLAPELTLEDSGELATGSFYAGIPHPPGYPLWTLYTWLWTVLLPVKNIAWRVAMGEAASGALAAALLALLVSRGSSLIIEGLADLKDLAGRWENAICTVSGFVAGLLLGFNGYMWSQSVIVEVYSFSLASFMLVLLCLMRWIYTPDRRRYLYLALFLHGVCFTNHQTLIVAALGIEIAIAAADFRMGRYLFLGNSIIYFAGLLLVQQHILTALEANKAVFVIFHVVGICSVAAYAWFTLLSRETLREFCLDAALAAVFLLLALVPAKGFICVFGSLLALAALIKLAFDTRRLGWEWLVVIACGVCWLAGASFYFYMPLAGMTNPPMQWGYPRTVEGFIHAFTRGQYEKTNPSDIIHNPGVFLTQLGMLGAGIIEEFNCLYAFLALVPFLFLFKVHKRERAWLIGVTAIYFFLGILLLILLNPPPDRAAQELVRVFFTASHTLIAIMVGYGLTLIAAYMSTHYRSFRPLGILGGLVAIGLAIYSFTELTEKTFFGQDSHATLGQLFSLIAHAFSNQDQYALPVYAGLLLIGLALAFVAALLLYRERAPLAITLALFSLMPLHPILTHWSDNEQHEHWFGYRFGHDMFTPPLKGADGRLLYPPMTKDAILFGGTDPGRFCPTYMIFCASFTPPACQPPEDQNFDRRDVYIITQNALADGTYLNYIRAHYNRSAQHDPPFFGGLVDFLQSQCLPPADRDAKVRGQELKLNTPARLLGNLDTLAKPLDDYFTRQGDRIEKRRRVDTSWFTEKDFANLPALVARLRPTPEQDPLSQYVYQHLSRETRQLLAVKSDEQMLRLALVKDLNSLLEKGPLYEPQRFQQVHLSEYLTEFIKQNPPSHTRIRLNRLLLEAGYPGALKPSLGGVYPDREIYIPSDEDSQRCYGEYLQDAGRRLQHDRQFPNEPPQIRPGEDVRLEPVTGRIQISGQIAVMTINGLITKVIFDHNPKNEFFLEESYPLDWMYPYLAPFGIIMKINRQPVAELTPELLQRDHEFWTQYTKRFIGDWLTYDTSVKEIAEFVEKVYLRRDYRGFTGDRKFIRDDQAQKAFSKLRNSIAGVYAWRLTQPSPAYRPKSEAEFQRLLREADFAFRQSFALCPYSPEVLSRYVNLLMSLRRFDDALLVATTCLKLDPFNGQFIGVVSRLKQIKKELGDTPLPQPNLAQMEKSVQANPSNFQAAFDLAGTYLQVQQTERALAVLDGVLNYSNVNPQALRALLQAYSSISNAPGLQATVQKLQARVQAEPSNFDAALGLIEGLQQTQQTNSALEVLGQVLNHPLADANVMVQVAQQYAALRDFPKLEAALERLTRLAPNSPEAWYDLSAIRAVEGKAAESVTALRTALDLGAQHLKQDPKAKNLLLEVQKDPRFAALRQTPEFQQLTAPK